MLRIGCAAAACLISSGCDSIVASGPSEETAYLDSEVIPQIINWWAGADEAFLFSRIAATRNYDKICLIDQYGSLHMVGREIDSIDAYNSTFGNTVPENYFAVVVIRKRTAHTTSVSLRKVPVGVIPGKLCVDANKAVLKRTLRSPDSQPYALLEPAS